MMIQSQANRSGPAVGLAAGLIKLVGEETNMTGINLVDWTIQEAQHLKAEKREPADFNDKSSLGKLLAVLEREPAGRTAADGPDALIATSIRLAVEEPVARLPSETVAAAEPVAVSDRPAAAPAASVISAEALTVEPNSALLMAIVEPDIYTARADRDRAVALRWVLRDIKNDRLKGCPVNEIDLRNLMEIGLVEMRNDTPVLTNAGVNAIT
jgi:hypothetical protein